MKHVFVGYLSACGRTRPAREFTLANSLLLDAFCSCMQIKWYIGGIRGKIILGQKIIRANINYRGKHGARKALLV
jgi:hypothetical protein